MHLRNIILLIRNFLEKQENPETPQLTVILICSLIETKIWLLKII